MERELFDRLCDTCEDVFSAERGSTRIKGRTAEVVLSRATAIFFLVEHFKVKYEQIAKLFGCMNHPNAVIHKHKIASDVQTYGYISHGMRTVAERMGIEVDMSYWADPKANTNVFKDIPPPSTSRPSRGRSYVFMKQTLSNLKVGEMTIFPFSNADTRQDIFKSRVNAYASGEELGMTFVVEKCFHPVTEKAGIGVWRTK